MWNDEDNNPYSSFDRPDTTHQSSQNHGTQHSETMIDLDRVLEVLG